jgi:hypothetical protein
MPGNDSEENRNMETVWPKLTNEEAVERASALVAAAIEADDTDPEAFIGLIYEDAGRFLVDGDYVLALFTALIGLARSSVAVSSAIQAAVDQIVEEDDSGFAPAGETLRAYDFGFLDEAARRFRENLDGV